MVSEEISQLNFSTLKAEVLTHRGVKKPSISNVSWDFKRDYEQRVRRHKKRIQKAFER